MQAIPTHVLFFKAIPPAPKATGQDPGHSDQPAHERLRQLADELERSAGADDVAGTDDDLPEDAAVDANADGAPDGGADLDGDGQADPTSNARPIDQPGGDDEQTDPTDPAAPGAAAAPGPDGAPPAGAPGDDAPGSDGAAFGPHNVEAGHHVAFQAGDFGSAGKVTATGEDGCTVQDKSGREHRVHWHEVKGHHDGAAAAGATDKKGPPPAGGAQ